MKNRTIWLSVLGIFASAAFCVVQIQSSKSDNLRQMALDRLNHEKEIALQKEITTRTQDASDRADQRMLEAGRQADERANRAAELSAKAEDRRASLALAVNFLNQPAPKDEAGKPIAFEKGQELMRRWSIKTLNSCTPENPIPEDNVDTLAFGISNWVKPYRTGAYGSYDYGFDDYRWIPESPGRPKTTDYYGDDYSYEE